MPTKPKGRVSTRSAAGCFCTDLYCGRFHTTVVGIVDERFERPCPRIKPPVVRTLRKRRRRRGQLATARLSPVVLPQRKKVLEKKFIGNVEIVRFFQPGGEQRFVPRTKALHYGN